MNVYEYNGTNIFMRWKMECSIQPGDSQVEWQPRTQDLSLGKTLAVAGHVPRPKFSARGGVVKVSNYMLPVGYYMYVYKPLKT